LSTSNRLLILEFSYWEHYKHAKDIAFIYPVDNPKRKEIEKSLNEILIEIQKIKGTK